VDVSKQHLIVPEEVEETLTTVGMIPISQSRQASKMCKTLRNEGVGEEGEEFNRRTEVFEEEDPDEAVGGQPPEVKRERRVKLEEQSRATDEVPGAENEPGTEPEIVAEVAIGKEPVFERVRYSTTIVGSNIAVPGFDTDFESFVRINKNHPFYQLVLNPMPPADRYRQALESLLFATAVAENKTIQNTADVELDTLQSIFDKYRRTLSQNLESWLMMNQDLFE
jgi:hypothetical protein